MKKTSTLLIAGSMLALATVASAGNQKGTFSISPTIGGITFDGTQHLQTSPIFGGRLGYNFTKALGFEMLFNYAKTESTRSSNKLNLYNYGGELLYHFMPDNKFVPYVAAGYSGINLKGTSSFATTEDAKGAPLYGIGAKYFVTDDVAWRVDVRHLMYEYDELFHSVVYTVGLYIPFGGAPAVAKLAEPPPPPAPVAKPVAPTPPPAPMAKLVANPASVTKGQPSTLTWSSQHATSCDLQPGIGAVETKGSMTVTPDDSTTYSVTCKGDGGAARSSAIVSVTALPPPPPKVSAAAERFCNKPALLMINFDTDKWDIKPRYHNELKTVGDFLKEFPKAKGHIDGHTDSTHTSAHNQTLSERRANSVKNYIIKNFGIAPERVGSRGYGEDRPVTTNKTKEGRAKNRRIEANFVCE